MNIGGQLEIIQTLNSIAVNIRQYYNSNEQLISTLWMVGWILIFLLPLLLTINFIINRSKILVDCKIVPYIPNISVLLPFKHLDYNLRKTIAELANQDYPGKYEIIFITSEIDGEAKKIVEQEIENIPNAKLIIATEIAQYCSDKVNNLLNGIRNAAKDTEVYAVIDSDIIPHKRWLYYLVQPLQIKQCGISSGSGWITGLHSDLLCQATKYWDFLASTQMTWSVTSFARGFSMAFKKAVFEEVKMAQVWENAFHDNFTLTSVIKENGYKINYAPYCLVSHCFNIRGWEWVQWTQRQAVNTRVNYNRLWKYGFSLITMPRFIGCIGFFVAITKYLLSGEISFWEMPFLYWPVIHFVNSYILINSIYEDRKFYHDYDNRWYIKLGLSIQSFASVILCLGSIFALFTKTITWRGLKYHEKSPFKTIVIAKEEKK